MSDTARSPFTLTGPMLGQPLEHFSCVQCGEGAQGFICLQLSDVEKAAEKPSLVLAYGLCQRCASLFWEEAGKKAMRLLKASVASVE